MLTKYLQKLIEETDHFGELQLRGKIYFCSFGYSNGLPYSAGACDNLPGKQSKETPKARTEHRCLCDGKDQDLLPGPVPLKTLRLAAASSPAPKAQRRRRGWGGGCRFQWLQLPLPARSRRPAGRPQLPGLTPSLPRFEQRWDDGRLILTVCWGMWRINRTEIN